MSDNPKSLLAAIELDFPDEVLVLGRKSAPREPQPRSPQRGKPVDGMRFHRNLAAIARRLRQRSAFAVGMVIAWFVVVVVTAVLSNNPYANVAAVGTIGGGTVWCINLMRRMNRELFATELLIAAAQEDSAHLSELVGLCRAILNGTLEEQTLRAAPTERPAAA